MSENLVKKLAADVGGTIEEMGRLPDGSGFAVMSMPLPTDHWLTAEGFNEPPMPMQTGTDDPRRTVLKAQIVAAARYAIRASTENGKDHDFDPDAMVGNFVIGLLGYYTPDGLSHVNESTAEPVEPPPADLSPSEALYAFAGWLTSRAEPVTMSAVHNAAPAAELVGEFCRRHHFAEPRPGWEKKIVRARA